MQSETDRAPRISELIHLASLDVSAHHRLLKTIRGRVSASPQQSRGKIVLAEIDAEASKVEIQGERLPEPALKMTGL